MPFVGPGDGTGSGSSEDEENAGAEPGKSQPGKASVRVKPEYYRQQAERSRALSKRALVGEIRSHLLKVAEEYDRLADEAAAKDP